LTPPCNREEALTEFQKLKLIMGPLRNVGTHIPIIAIAIGIKSSIVFLFNAARTPDKTPITSAISIAYIANSKVIR
jgi:hypothetical protein